MAYIRDHYSHDQMLRDSEYKDSYPGEFYPPALAQIPAEQSYWNVETPTDVKYRDEHPQVDGLNQFHYFYAANTCIPGPYRPRPVPINRENIGPQGLQLQFAQTQNLRYTTPDGLAPAPANIYRGDAMINQYYITDDTIGDGIRKENCGCGAVKLPGL
jgi:hypothetical protein